MSDIVADFGKEVGRGGQIKGNVEATMTHVNCHNIKWAICRPQWNPVS